MAVDNKVASEVVVPIQGVVAFDGKPLLKKTLKYVKLNHLSSTTSLDSQ